MGVIKLFIIFFLSTFFFVLNVNIFKFLKVLFESSLISVLFFISLDLSSDTNVESIDFF